MRWMTHIALLAGAVLFTSLIVYQGAGDVAAAVAGAGWGLLWVAMYRLVPLCAEAVAWQRLLKADHRLPLRTVVWARWVGQSINNLLPVMRVGGELVRARLLVRKGVAGAAAGASVVVDLTATVLTQIVFGMIGVGLLVLQLGASQAAMTLMVGIGLFGVLLAGFFVVQSRGLFGALARLLERMAGGRNWLALVGSADALDAAIVELYQDRRRVASASTWCMIGWLLGTGEAWLALRFLGHPVSLLDALMIESLGQAVRAVGFAVPGALGVQEGGFLLLASLLGMNPGTILALSLIKRVRELTLGIPGLAAWQWDEGRLLRRRFAESVP